VTERLGLALLGCAHLPHALSYARAASESTSVRLVAAWDGDPDIAQSVAGRFGVRLAESPEALVGMSGVDAVVVCSATADHRHLVELAAAAGRHVLSEKPIATSLADARAMVDACDRAGVQLHIAFVTRFYPLVQRVRSLVGEGAIGEVRGLVGGNRGRPPLPPVYPDWITDPARAGGGALIDHSVHVTDVMRHVTGLEVADVGAEVDAGFWNAGVDDMALLSLGFAGGAVGSVDPSWSVPADNPWHYDFYLRLLGTTGALTIGDTAESLNLVGRVGRPGQVLVPFGVDIDALLLGAFADSIRAGRVLDPCADGEDGIRALEIAIAAYRASASGTRIALPLDLA
jgi:predicted dehydrogenase